MVSAAHAYSRRLVRLYAISLSTSCRRLKPHCHLTLPREVVAMIISQLKDLLEGMTNAVNPGTRLLHKVYTGSIFPRKGLLSPRPLNLILS